MDSGLTLLLREAGTVVGVLVFLYVSLARGWLWTDRAVRKIVEAHKEIIDHERIVKNEWREAARLTEEAAREDRRQLRRLLEITEAHTNMLKAILEAAERRSQ